jgi:hypothetical protein
VENISHKKVEYYIDRSQKCFVVRKALSQKHFVKYLTTILSGSSATRISVVAGGLSMLQHLSLKFLKHQ